MTMDAADRAAFLASEQCYHCMRKFSDIAKTKLPQLPLKVRDHESYTGKHSVSFCLQKVSLIPLVFSKSIKVDHFRPKIPHCALSVLLELRGHSVEFLVESGQLLWILKSLVKMKHCAGWYRSLFGSTSM